MISPASDYRPIDARPARWSSTLNPLSTQKRGLVHWLPLQRIDVAHYFAADRRYRPSASAALSKTTWFLDEYRGSYGAVQVSAGGNDAPVLPLSVTTVPLTITCWMRRLPASQTGISVWLGTVNPGSWDAFYIDINGTEFRAVQAESTIFGVATPTFTLPMQEWIFCAGIFVSNSDRWAFCNGVASAHNTDPLTPVATKNSIALTGKPTGGGAGSNQGLSTTLRDIRIYNYALDLSQIEEIYSNPYDLFQAFDRDDDYQFFTASEAIESISPPALSIPVTLHTPEIFAPVSLEVPAQAITTTGHAPAIQSDLGFQVSALTVSVMAHTPASVNFEEEVIVEDERELEPHNFKVRIVAYVGGDDLRISRTYTELPGGVTIGKGYLTIKRIATSDDAQAILQKQITASEGVTGQITDASTVGGSIELYFDLTGAETATLTPLLPYHYDVQVISQAGAIYTCEKGVIVMQQGVTDATN